MTTGDQPIRRSCAVTQQMGQTKHRLVGYATHKFRSAVANPLRRH